MTRRAFLQTYFLKFAIALAMLGLIAYALGHAMGWGADALLTTPVRTVTDSRITSAEAYLFRNEVLLTQTTQGLVDELVTSGSRVGKNVEVAKFYPSDLEGEALAGTQQRLTTLNRAIRILEAGNAAGGSLSQADGFRTDAMASYMEICSQIKQGALDTLTAEEEALLADINRYLILTGQQTDVDALLEELRAQKSELLTGGSFAVQNTRSSGVYYGADYVDGYEAVFTEQAARELTSASFDALCKSSPTENAGQLVGKMVYGYAWYLALQLPPSLGDSMTVGECYEIAFPENGGCVLELTLEHMDGTLAVFCSEESPTSFVYYRSQEVHITLDTSEGFYIPDTAIHEVDGTEGVYIFDESVARFRRIAVLYRGDGYVIVSRDAEGTELNEYDVLITSGGKLYDGKVYE